MYKITFEDDTVFDGGTPEDSKWNDIPDKKIQKIDYRLGNMQFYMGGFEKYNHVVEKYQLVNKNMKFISKVILMGCTNERVYQVIFDIRNNKILRTLTKYGKEYMGKNTTGWKKGIQHGKPKIKFLTN